MYRAAHGGCIHRLMPFIVWRDRRHSQSLLPLALICLTLTLCGLPALGQTGQTICTPLPACSTSSVAVPVPVYSLNFSTAPPVGATYSWESSEAGDALCPYRHSGIASFNGSLSQFVDLNAAPGAASSGGVALPSTLGGVSSGSLALGTAGWSFEVTFRPSSPTTGKLMSIGAGQPLSNLVLGPQGKAPGFVSIQGLSYTGLNFAVFDSSGSSSNGHMGAIGVVNPLLVNQWYHVVAVVQQLTTDVSPSSQAASFVYVNGALLNFTSTSVSQNNLFIASTPRPFAYLGQSNWPADPYWTGLIDTFRIYNSALTASQVASLYSSEMGGCPLTSLPAPSVINTWPNLLPRTASATISPFYSLTFSTNATAACTPNCAFGWSMVSATDSAAQQAVHSGLLELNGQAQFVNLSAPTGPSSLGASFVLPTIGGGSSGWSVEVVVKPGPLSQWSKIFDIGSLRSSSGPAAICRNDIVSGWDNVDVHWQFTICDNSGNGYEFDTSDAFGVITPGLWYHLVMVIAPSMPIGGLANYLLYCNGALYTSVSNVFYPPAVQRSNAFLGRSGWVQDTNFSGELDIFNIYDLALSDVQVSTLYALAMGAVGGGSSGLSAGGIAGSVIGSLAGAFLVGLLCWYVWTRQDADGGKSSRRSSDSVSEDQRVVEMGITSSDMDNATLDGNTVQ